MRNSLLVVVPVVLLATSSWAGTTVKSSKSNSSDYALSKLLSASVNLSGPSDTKVVYKAPPTGDFVLTQLCVSAAASGGIVVSASGLGPIVHLGAADSSCQTFAPGMILPANSEISCSTLATAAAGSYFCTISGLQGSPAPFAQ